MSKKRNEAQWRKEQQNPELFQNLKYVAPVLTVLALGANLCYLLWGSTVLYMLCLILFIIPLALDMIMPAYFTLIPSKKGEKKNAWQLQSVLLPHVIVLCLSYQKNWLNENLFWMVFAICAVLTLGFVCLLKEKVELEKLTLAVIIFLGGVVGWMEAGHLNENLAFSEPECYMLMVENLDSRNGGNKVRRYECTVTLPDGRRVELNIPGKVYRELEIGSLVQVEHGIGALGIEYASVSLPE